MKLTKVVLGALATYRIATMVTQEAGPFEIFFRFREKYPPSEYSPAPYWVGEGIRCPLCVSFWLSWATAALVRDENPYPLRAMAIAGLVAFMVHATEPE